MTFRLLLFAYWRLFQYRLRNYHATGKDDHNRLLAQFSTYRQRVIADQ